MIQKLANSLPCNKAKSKKGFTLAELLIVIAIIAILIAIAIPIYNAQMDKARSRVDESAMRAAMSTASADYLLNNKTSEVVYTADKAAVGGTGGGDAQNMTVREKTTTKGTLLGTSTANKGKAIEITIKENGEVKEAKWA